jgi:nitrite reductase/ring-hydroxylating ferredoxin subunit
MLLQWIKIEQLQANELEEQKIQEVKAGEKIVCLLRSKGNIYAFAAQCPHQGAPFCNGWLDAQGRIVCPLHKYRFDPANGRNTSGEGYKLRTYPTEVRDGFIYIGLIV